jgi:hypothetical protein
VGGFETQLKVIHVGYLFQARGNKQTPTQYSPPISNLFVATQPNPKNQIISNPPTYDHPPFLNLHSASLTVNTDSQHHHHLGTVIQNQLQWLQEVRYQPETFHSMY